MQDRSTVVQITKMNMSDVKQDLEALAIKMKELCEEQVEGLEQICSVVGVSRAGLSDAINTLLTPNLGRLSEIKCKPQIAGFFSMHHPSLSDALQVASAFGRAVEHRGVEELANMLTGLLGLKAQASSSRSSTAP